MLIVLLVATPDACEPVVGPGAAAQLRALGISRVSVLRDGPSTGVVLEGWAFRPGDIADATRAIFPSATKEVRTFHEIEHVAVPATATRRSA
jgi:hypothetical protein